MSPDSAAPVRQPVAPSGDQIVLTHGDHEAVVVTCGAGLRTYRAGDRDLVDGYGAAEVCPAAKGQLLIPWPNRIRNATYTFAGAAHHLDVSEPARGTAIHGLLRWVTWRVARQTATEAVFEYRLPASRGYPFVLDCQAAYAIGDDGLAVSMSARNVGALAAPYGAGAHPYVTASEDGVDSCNVTLCAERRLITDETMIPADHEAVADTPFDLRGGRDLRGEVLDTCFTGLERDAGGVAHTVLRGDHGAVDVWQDAAMDYVMVFSGDTLEPPLRRRGLAIEPMTCAPNAFESGDGLVVLEPGEEHTCRWGIRPLG